jgi:hypothetical protein
VLHGVKALLPWRGRKEGGGAPGCCNEGRCRLPAAVLLALVGAASVEFGMLQGFRRLLRRWWTMLPWWTADATMADGDVATT